MNIMADVPSLPVAAERSRMDTHDEYGLRYWTEILNVTPEELIRAVNKVGPMVDDVRKELNR